MRIVLLIVLSLGAGAVYSQSAAIDTTGDSVSVIVHKDPRLDMLVKKQIEINEETSRNARRSAKGFRLMVINTNKREDAIAAKTKVYTHFPELKPYLIYQSPYFKLKVGNFKEKKDAEAYQKKLDAFFPQGVFVIGDVIEVKLDKDQDTPDPTL